MSINPQRLGLTPAPGAGAAHPDIETAFGYHLTDSGPRAVSVGDIFGPVQRPANLPNAVVTIFISGGGSVNVQLQDSPVSGPGAACADTNGAQTGITGFGSTNPFIVMGLQSFASLKITSVSGTVIFDAWITFHAGQRPQSSSDVGTVTQGNHGSVGQGWYVAITDLTNIVAIDNTSALRTSLYAEGSGAAGDTALRVGTVRQNIAAQNIVNGAPLTIYTPPAGKKPRVMGYHLTVDTTGASVIFKSNATELFRTGNVNPGTVLESPGGGLTNGALGLVANDPIKLDVTTTTVVSGFVDLCYE